MASVASEGCPSDRTASHSPRNLNLFWMGQMITDFGDWFNAIAVFSLLLELGGPIALSP